jgi:hypothetical protein
MAVAAAVTRFREETVAQFEQTMSQLKMATTKENMQSGLSAVFLVSGANGDTATTRGQNGLISYSGRQNTQVTITLKERHAAKSMTGFDVFASQGNQADGLKGDVIGIINRDIDLTVLAALANATQDYGTGTMDLVTILGAKAILGNNQVPTNEVDNMFGLISPAAEAYMLQIPEFTNAQYVDIKPYADMNATASYRRWAGINWIVSPLVSGLGTASELLYIWHRRALGHAMSFGAEKVFADYNKEHAYNWARAELYHEAAVLQNAGIIKITHDGSGFVAT